MSMLPRTRPKRPWFPWVRAGITVAVLGFAGWGLMELGTRYLGLQKLIIEQVNISGPLVAILVLGLVQGAYASEIFRAAILAIPVNIRNHVPDQRNSWLFWARCGNPAGRRDQMPIDRHDKCFSDSRIMKADC